MWQRVHHFFSRPDQHDEPVRDPNHFSWPDQPPPPSKKDWSTLPVGVGLPRQATFRRQNSEKRDRLTPVEPNSAERRAVSSARASGSVSVARRMRASSTPPTYHPARTSAPAAAGTTQDSSDVAIQESPAQLPFHTLDVDLMSQHLDDGGSRPPRPPSITSSAMSHHPILDDIDDKAQIKAELDTKWILNLSMHFRDKSDREKFFVTYAETPTKWRRVTVSCDYRNAEPGSLEMDLKELQFQRDKSLQIYESIRDSLPEIQFYDTVTNLKLETSDGRLHVHVTEDVNETIPYPPRSTVAHILYDEEYRPTEVRESELQFESHLSGFVYKVVHNGRVYIKKEIPGPDTVDEFLYEINALHALHGSRNVIRLEAIIVDDTHQLVKGLLIGYAEQGAIVDLLYDYKGRIPWENRLRWARDSVVGLSEIHEEGYVQGDFTLSNIVVDAEGNAKIIDINRRGCPVGWEPPEIATKIASHQRISMYIGEKSDLYQLGMTLWGLAADDDEPERHDPPLSVDVLPSEVPEWYRDIIRTCLNSKPRLRQSAKELVARFPSQQSLARQRLSESPHSMEFRGQKRYIHPQDAVERDDIERFGWKSGHEQSPYSPESSRFDETFTYPRSSNYDRGSDVSEFERPRGRALPRNLRHLSHEEMRGWGIDQIPAPPLSDGEPQIISVSPRMGPQYDEIDLDGRRMLIARNTLTLEDLDMLDDRAGRGRSRHHSSTLKPEDIPLPESEDNGTASLDSESTPRHSRRGLLEDLSPVRGNTPEADPDHRLLGINNALPALSPTPHNFRLSHSPQPPPSLTYADSGFHEPAEDEESSLSQPNVESDEGIPTLKSEKEDQEAIEFTASPEDHSGPPRLGRSDTSIWRPQVQQTSPIADVGNDQTDTGDTEDNTSTRLSGNTIVHDEEKAQPNVSEAASLSEAPVSLPRTDQQVTELDPGPLHMQDNEAGEAVHGSITPMPDQSQLKLQRQIVDIGKGVTTTIPPPDENPPIESPGISSRPHVSGARQD
jgi:serine/threonine protein kinase